MAIAQSRISPQGQVSVPVEVRKKLGLEPGSVVEWEDRGDEIVVRHARLHTLDEIHRALFPEGPPPPVTVEQMDEAISSYVTAKHARR
jgi:AbrB family looped-hinge helix DNA binding protein